MDSGEHCKSVEARLDCSNDTDLRRSDSPEADGFDKSGRSRHGP